MQWIHWEAVVIFQLDAYHKLKYYPVKPVQWEVKVTCWHLAAEVDLSTAISSKDEA